MKQKKKWVFAMLPWSVLSIFEAIKIMVQNAVDSAMCLQWYLGFVSFY